MENLGDKPRLERVKAYYKQHRNQHPKPYHTASHCVMYRMLCVPPTNLKKLLSLNTFLNFDKIDEKVSALIPKDGIGNPVTEICFARVPRTTKSNAIWVYIPYDKHTKLSRTMITAFLTLCKKGKLLPKYVKTSSIVDKFGNISVVLDITKGSIYDNEQLLYIYLCVLRHPNEDAYFVKLVKYLMSVEYNPITAWIFGSKCDKVGAGHNFVNIEAGGYPTYKVPIDISDISHDLSEAIGIYEILEGKVKHSSFHKDGARGFSCYREVSKTTDRKKELSKKYFQNETCLRIEEFNKAVEMLKDIY